MVSFHAKGGVAIAGGHVEMNLGNQLPLHRTGFNIGRRVLPVPQTPIVISEADPDGCAACSAEDAPADAYRNSTAYGAYEVAMMKRTLELEARAGVKLRGVLTWAFCFDGYAVSSPAIARSRPTGSTAGAQRLQAAGRARRRPADRHQQRRPDARRHSDQQRAAAGRRRRHGDAQRPRGAGAGVELPRRSGDRGGVARACDRDSCRSSFGARATVTHLRVDETHGDAYTVWVSQGSPRDTERRQKSRCNRRWSPRRSSRHARSTWSAAR